MASRLDTQQVTICPGEGNFTRGAGRVRGTAKGEQNTMEWQWAQGAMFGYFCPDFKFRYPEASFVLTENEYTRLLTHMTGPDRLLNRLFREFRRDYKAGGLLRPDILGFCARPPQAGPIVLELLEVSTADQAVATLRDDIGYKLNKFEQIIRGLDPDIKEGFSLTSYSVQAGPSKWRPTPMYQRIVPLPPSTDEQGNKYIEWICFQPTFNRNWPYGIDGLLLYEIHRMPYGSELPVVRKLIDEEKRRRQAARTPYGVTLTPWLNEEYLGRMPRDRDALRMAAALMGVGLLALLAVELLPVVAGLELGAAALGTGLAEAGAGAGVAAEAGEVGAAALAARAAALPTALETAARWLSALGRHLVLSPKPA
ncbi:MULTISPECIES: hypothetical protein [unclassified Streptomyces]|uniref:hypothetical protein n=1 Tax=unclassified Streptomyces TaxID=2593676 RepID=UPI0033C674B5